MGKLYQHSVIKTYQISLLESRTHRALCTYMTAYLGELGLTLSEWSILGILHEQSSLRPVQIANLLGVKPPVVTPVLGTLEFKGFVDRSHHESDSRSVIIALTTKGRNILSVSEKQFSKELREFMGGLTLPELILYVRVITKLSNKL